MVKPKLLRLTRSSFGLTEVAPVIPKLLRYNRSCCGLGTDGAPRPPCATLQKGTNSFIRQSAGSFSAGNSPDFKRFVLGWGGTHARVCCARGGRSVLCAGCAMCVLGRRRRAASVRRAPACARVLACKRVVCRSRSLSRASSLCSGEFLCSGSPAFSSPRTFVVRVAGEVCCARGCRMCALGRLLRDK